MVEIKTQIKAAASVLIALILFSAYHYWPQEPYSSECFNSFKTTRTDYAAEIKVFVGGEEISIPDKIGYQDDCTSELTTNDRSIVRIRSNAIETKTIQDFFIGWQQLDSFQEVSEKFTKRPTIFITHENGLSYNSTTFGGSYTLQPNDFVVIQYPGED